MIIKDLSRLTPRQFRSYQDLQAEKLLELLVAYCLYLKKKSKL